MQLNQSEIGKRFGATSHEIGRWLKEIGLRSQDGQPSREARAGGYVTLGPTYNGHASYRWDEEKTIRALEAAGHRPRPPVSTGRIVGPFTARQSSANGFEILSGDGTVAIWVIGRANAEAVSGLLNLAYQHGKFGGNQSRS